MHRLDAFLAHARDPRLAPYAFAAAPAWLWRPQAGIVWANAAGAALMREETPAAVVGRAAGADDALARELARLSATLPASGAGQLARLRGLSGRLITCSCSRLRLDEAPGVLVVAAERMGKPLPLVESVRRVFAAAPELAVFSAAGELLYAGAAVRAHMPASLGALGAAALAAGEAEGATPAGHLRLQRLGSGDATVLIARCAEAPAEAPPAPVSQPLAESPEEPQEIAPEPAVPAPEELASELPDAPPEPQEAAPELQEIAAEPLASPTPQEAEPASPEITSAPAAAMLEAAEQRLVQRRHPLRFVWTIDAQGQFAIEPGEFTALIGAPMAGLAGLSWEQASQRLGLDPEGRVSRAVGSHDTFSGVTVHWPVEASAERLPVVLSGLPVVDRERRFRGYRGFGVCREVDRIAAALAARRAALAPPPAPAEAASEPTPAPPAEEGSRPPLTVVPPSKNVVPFRATTPPERRPALNAVERTAFQEIARALGARLEGEEPEPPPVEAETPAADSPRDAEAPPAEVAGEEPSAPALPEEIAALLDRLPLGALVYRGDAVLFANRALLEWTGHASAAALAAAGGIEALFADAAAPAEDGSARPLALRAAAGAREVEARLSALPFDGEKAMLLTLLPAPVREPAPPAPAETPELVAARATAAELRSILDTATDGVVVVDAEGRITALNRSAEALFGYEGREIEHAPFLTLFAPESERDAADYFDGLTRSGVASLLNDGREVIGRVRQGGLVPLFMTMGRIAEAPARFCAVLRDITQWKRAEEELTAAKQQAEKSSSAKSDFLAKISHEIRTPLNAIIGFSEVMLEERFGPVGNERYRDYLRDIRTSGEHMISLLNDLLDLSKIEAGKLDLTFTPVNLNDAMQQCVAIMQPQANRDRIIIRSALATALPPVVADARSVRQIILNLLSNSIKFTGAGGQVIVSTALTDAGEAVLRVRDTGVGMSEKDIETALQPFRQLPTAVRLNAAGTGLGLPLTKALAEANRAAFHIKSVVNSGTLVEIVFPANRVLAE